MAESSSFGPSGGMFGEVFRDNLIAASEQISAITVWSGLIIDAVQLTAIDANSGAVRDLAKHGGSGGAAQTFHLDRDEFITGISGRYGLFVDMIKVTTNKQQRSFRDDGGQASYEYTAPDGHEIVGFHGIEGGPADALAGGLVVEALNGIGLGGLANAAEFVVAIGVIIRKRK